MVCNELVCTVCNNEEEPKGSASVASEIIDVFSEQARVPMVHEDDLREVGRELGSAPRSAYYTAGLPPRTAVREVTFSTGVGEAQSRRTLKTRVCIVDDCSVCNSRNDGSNGEIPV